MGEARIHIRAERSEQETVSVTSLRIKYVSNLECYTEPETINVARFGKKVIDTIIHLIQEVDRFVDSNTG